MIEVREYITAHGKVPYRDWLLDLDGATKARIDIAVLRMQSGNLASTKSVGTGVSELRFDFGPGYRVYFGREGERLVLLLGGGTKKRQQADIVAAQRLWAEYKSRKREI
jgi:putative addiction module killer protein